LSDSSSSGVIRFEVDEVSTLKDDCRFSPEIEVGGVPWKARVGKCLKKDTTELWLMIALQCTNEQSTPWRIDVDAQFILVNSDIGKNFTHTKSEPFQLANWWRGCYLKNWAILMDEENGFIKDDKVTVEIHFSITGMKGIKIHPLMDFTDPNEPCHDIALIIEGEKIVDKHKQFLSLQSPVLKAMFYDNFDEKNKKEFQLKEVNREEFVEMLHMMYPSGKKITEISSDDSVEYLLKLGDQFQI
ncbi:hypothetical protein PENTCL1PPCAC_7776, partial [Pristionchus entomophagus]